MVKNKFPKNLTAVLASHERILQLYQAGDLLEIFQLTDLFDTWESVRIDGELYDLNLYYNGKFQVLTIYQTFMNEKDELVTNKQLFMDILLEVE